MADDAKAAEATEDVNPSSDEQDGSPETDWKSQARKWERRAKENGKELEKLRESVEAGAKDAQDAGQKAAQELADAKAEIKRLKATAEREKRVRDIARSSGVDADILMLMVGDTEDEISANAKLLTERMKTRWPEVKDGGAKASRMTKDDILAIKDQNKRLQAIQENADLFRK